jgi:hypothetical protein
MPLSTLYQDDGTFIIPSPSSVKGSAQTERRHGVRRVHAERAVQELFPKEHLYSAWTDVADQPAIRCSP